MKKQNEFKTDADEKREAVEQSIFKEESPSTGTTSTGLEENIAGLLCYLFSIVSGVVFLVLEKENKFIRFHAMQAILTFIFVAGISIILSFIPFIGWIISLFLAPLGFFLSIFLMYQAYQGKMFKLPFIGDLAEQHSAPK